jgi:hypothetical protein
MAQLAEIEQRLARATSLLVVLRDRLPDDARAARSLARQRGVAVDAIFHRFRDGEYLDALYREGVGLFEGALPHGDGSQLFIDCEVGYELPGWAAIEAAGSLAYQLLWRRTGVTIEVEGKVKKWGAGDGLLELSAARPTFVDLRNLAAKLDAILRHRVEHGPITDPSELAKLLGPGGLTTATLAHIDFAPAGESATESAGG